MSPHVTSLRAGCGLHSALLWKARFPAVTASCNNKKERPEAVFHWRSKSLPIPWGKEQRLGYLQQRCTQWSRWAPRLAGWNTGWKMHLNGRGPNIRSWQVNALTGDGRPAASPLRLAAEGLPVSHCAGLSSSWESGDCTRIKPSGTSWIPQRRHQDGWGSKGAIRGIHIYLDGDWSHLAGSPGRGCVMLKDLKHPMTPGNITDLHKRQLF